jgi:hypothetical protein
MSDYHKNYADQCEARIKELQEKLLISNEACKHLGRMCREEADEDIEKKLGKSKRLIKNLMHDMDESCCTCGGESPNPDQSYLSPGCYYHEALEFIK